MSQIGKDCVLCFDQIQYIGLGTCNHKEMCYKCHYKMRVFSNSKQCPLCNSQNMEIIVTDESQTDFNGYSLDHIPLFNKKAGIYAANDEILKELEKLIEIKCFAYNCKEDVNEFKNIAGLRKHLKDKHQRYLCDICMEYKTCILQEQKLYTQQGLEKHTQKGDFDDEGNIYFFHPYCNFCLKYFYDEEAMMRHLPDHFTCFVCGPEHKYIYYKDYKQLEKHFKLSHYLCEDKQCLEKCFTVFKSAPELDIHNSKVHHTSTGYSKLTINQMNLQSMTGFSFSDSDQRQIKTKDDSIKDREGHDFEGQFLSLRKTKMKNTQIDSHDDEPIDYRDFYCQKYDEKYLIEEKNILTQYYNENYKSPQFQTVEPQDERGNTRGKKLQLSKRKHSQKNDELCQEDITLLRYYQIYGIGENQLMDKLSLVLDQSKYEIFEENQKLLMKKKITARQFYDMFVGLVGKAIALRLFPVIAASLNQKYEIIQKDLDDVYIAEMKSLPQRYTTMINSSETYKQFFKLFRKLIEEQLSKRIRGETLKLRLKDLKMDRARRFQLIEILRRVRTKEMAKLKFVSNFGVSVEVSSLILRKVFFAHLDKVQDLLEQIPNHEFLHLFVYVQFKAKRYINNYWKRQIKGIAADSVDLLEGKNIQQEKQAISVNMLKDYFANHQDIYKQFYPKGENIDEKDDEEQLKQHVGKVQQGLIQQSNATAGQHSKAAHIDTQDIYEFPAIQGNSQKNDYNKVSYPTTVKITNKPASTTSNKPSNSNVQSKQTTNNGFEATLPVFSGSSKEDPALPVYEVIPPKQPIGHQTNQFPKKQTPQQIQQQFQQQILKKSEAMSGWDNAGSSALVYESQDAKIRGNQVQKNDFPTLGGGSQLTPFSVPKKKHQSIFPEDEKPQKPEKQQFSEPKKEIDEWSGNQTQLDKNDVANLKVVGKKKGKGGQVQVSLAGYFK